VVRSAGVSGRFELPSRSIDEGIKLLAKVLDRLQGAGLKLKASKCKLLQTEVKVLGVIVSQGSVGLREDPERAAVIIFALKHWRHYLIGREVLVRSDHSALQYLLTSKELSPRNFLSRWRPCEIAT
jgi:hypothetical protein